MSVKTFLAVFLAGTLFTVFVPAAFAEGRLVIYCSMDYPLCQAQVEAFAKKYDVKISFLQNSSGGMLAKINAEKRKPQADVWYGGPLNIHFQAGELGALQPYQSPNLADIIPKFRDPTITRGNMSSAVSVGILGFGVNTVRLREKKLPMPSCWSDLLKVEYRDEIEIADPHSSGTGYMALATFVQLWGEDKAFDYLRAMDANILRYTMQGATPARSVARGKAAIGVGFLSSYAQEKGKGAFLELVVPCEGTSYRIGSVSIIKDAYNIENARLFVDWVLSKEAQENTWKRGESCEIVTNITAQNAPCAAKLDGLDLIDSDIDLFGSTAMRRHLIDRWIDAISGNFEKLEK